MTDLDLLVMSCKESLGVIGRKITNESNYEILKMTFGKEPLKFIYEDSGLETWAKQIGKEKAASGIQDTKISVSTAKKMLDAGIDPSTGTKIAKPVTKVAQSVSPPSPDTSITTGQIMGTAAVLAAILYASYKIYQRFFSQAAKACNQLSSKQKSLCMARYKIKAFQDQINYLSSSSKMCNKSKNPSKCKLAVDQKRIKLLKKVDIEKDILRRHK